MQTNTAMTHYKDRDLFPGRDDGQMRDQAERMGSPLKRRILSRKDLEAITVNLDNGGSMSLTHERPDVPTEDADGLYSRICADLTSALNQEYDRSPLLNSGYKAVYNAESGRIVARHEGKEDTGLFHLTRCTVEPNPHHAAYIGGSGTQNIDPDSPVCFLGTTAILAAYVHNLNTEKYRTLGSVERLGERAREVVGTLFQRAAAYLVPVTTR
ncbi:hypothetical protein HZB01_04835 [Candidatus Woesearchaeota archaeon]|nr:hypothetical protein [Candidatus Woesearchaeota archaeon]